MRLGRICRPAKPNALPQRPKVDETAIEEVAKLVSKGGKTAFLLEHHAAEQSAMSAASKIEVKWEVNYLTEHSGKGRWRSWTGRN